MAAPKVTTLAARPDVALTIDGGDTPGQARALSIRGRASVEIVDGVVRSIWLPPGRPWTPKRRPSSRRTITPRWVRYYDFGAGRMPRFLQELAEQHQS
jgi:hypothetical protein